VSDVTDDWRPSLILHRDNIIYVSTMSGVSEKKLTKLLDRYEKKDGYYCVFVDLPMEEI
jgi:hypothetical protein